jgi:histidinol-phosphatase (PHP family)
MFKSTFHAHSRFDDGKEELESYIQEAIAKKFNVFGFSAHAPVIFDSSWNMKSENFEEYIQTAKFLREKYKDSLEIYTGLETDYYPGCTDWRNKKGIDYTIGGVHFLKNEETGGYMPVDGTRQEFEQSLKEGFDGDIDAFISAYFGMIRDMLLNMPPNIVAHLDVFRKNNSSNAYFSEDDEHYREEVSKTLEIISLTQAIVEINTGGMSRGYVKEPYPSIWVLQACHDLDIPIIINSDAHSPDMIDAYYPQVVQLLKYIGYGTQRILCRDEWRDVSL